MVAHRLLHIHLPSRGPYTYPPYTIASRLQEYLRRCHLDFKDSSANTNTTTDTTTHDHGWPPPGVIAQRLGSTAAPAPAPAPAPPGPPPMVLSFTPLPTYTLGRRQTAPLSKTELARLQAPLHFRKHNGLHHFPVTVLPSPRGGLTTYHGPGQIVLWPVMDLRSRYHENFTVRCYSRLLEDTTIATLGGVSRLISSSASFKQEFSHFKKEDLIEAFTTEDPGVWVKPLSTSQQLELSSKISNKTTGPAVAKIAALGVHLRRHVSALGTAINVANVPGLEEEDRDEETNPWARFVPCGLEGKAVTSIERELIPRLMMLLDNNNNRGAGLNIDQIKNRIDEEFVAREWTHELSGRLKCDEGGVDRMSPGEVARLVLEVCGGGGEPSASALSSASAATTTREGGDVDLNPHIAELEMKYLSWLRQEFKI